MVTTIQQQERPTGLGRIMIIHGGLASKNLCEYFFIIPHKEIGIDFQDGVHRKRNSQIFRK